MKIPCPATEKEYSAYAQKLARIRRAELLKLPGKRDLSLIEECGLAILHCEQRLSELRAGRKAGLRPLKRTVWRAAAVAAAVLVTVAASVISYASGRRALSDRVQWNVRHIRVADDENRSGNGETTVPRDDGKKREFSSEEALRAAYGSNLLLPGSFRGVYFVSAAAWGDPGNALIRCEYRVNKKPLTLEIDSFAGADRSSYTETAFYYPRDFTVRRFSKLLVGEGPDCCFVYFINGSDNYVLTGGQGTGIVTDIAQRMIKQGRGN